MVVGLHAKVAMQSVGSGAKMAWPLSCRSETVDPPKNGHGSHVAEHGIRPPLLQNEVLSSSFMGVPQRWEEKPR